MNKKNLKNLSSLAAVINVTHAEARVLKIPVDKIRSKEQVRKIFNNIDELAGSLRTEGQQSPIIVSPADSEGMYTIQKGERRWRAAKEAKFTDIEAIVKAEPKDIVEKAAGELVENIQRENLTPMEIADALNIFINEDWSQQEIATRLGKNKSFVSAHLGLLKIPPCVRELHELGVVTDTETLNILRGIFDEKKDKCEALCKRALKDGGISRKVCRDALNELRHPNPKNQDQSSLQGVTGSQGQEADDNALKFETKSLEQGLNEHPDQSQDEPSNKPHVTDDGQIDLVAGADADAGADTDANIGESTGDDEKKAQATDTNIDPAKWEAVDPFALIVNVSVIIRESSRPGTLMLDRISLNPLHVWVYLTDEQVGHLALATDITFKSVKKNPNRVQ